MINHFQKATLTLISKITQGSETFTSTVSEDAEIVTKNGNLYIRYDEKIEHYQSKVTMKLNEEQIQLIKHGDSAMHLSFVKGKQTQGTIHTPHGSMFVTTTDVDFTLEQTESHTALNLSYTLLQNNENLGEFHLKFDLKSKDSL